MQHKRLFINSLVFKLFAIKLAVFLSLFFFGNQCLSDVTPSVPLINVTLDREVYQFLDRMAVKYSIDGGLVNTRPLSRNEIASLLLNVAEDAQTDKINLTSIERAHLLAYLGWYADESINVSKMHLGEIKKKKYLGSLSGESYKFTFSPEIQQKITVHKPGANTSETSYITSTRGLIFGNIRRSFAFATDLKYRAYRDDTGFLKQAADEYAYKTGEFLQTTKVCAYARFGLPWFELEIGTDQLWWGAGRHGALLLSDNSPPLDLVKLSGNYGPIRFTSLTTKLHSKLDSKYLSGHRLESKLPGRITLGIHESVIYGNRSEPHYMNPFTIYYITTHIIESESGYVDNLMLGLDIAAQPFSKTEVYGEFMVDDFQPQLGLVDGWRNWDSKFGILLGFYWIDPFLLPDTDLRFEYTFINQYAYTHERPIDAYTNSDVAIGHWLGNDADNLWIDIKHWFTPKLQGAISYERTRSGEGDVNKPYPPGAPLDVQWEFLSGTVEQEKSIKLGLTYKSIGAYTFNAQYTRSWIQNYAHQTGIRRTTHIARVVVGCQF